ncbi:uncharacterized protein LOC105431987 [Pogonomyrmex barbatus]|uniref:Uncharacterized protein LOC105431987 n=1 Tax=Pogonomyrmex barbatus TaxID=144034 RepID=A0A6I9WRH6_9HYME|nr:uncharacterized protein LOC105431987 [Pogonomyrmex barbatus]
MAKESNRRRSRRFQFPPMWPYIEKNAARGELIPASKRHGTAPLLPRESEIKLKTDVCTRGKRRRCDGYSTGLHSVRQGRRRRRRNVDDPPTRFYTPGSRKHVIN